MNATASMLEARIGLLARLRRVEHALARDEQVAAAASIMRGRSHDLGNAIQIVKLSAIELERRMQGNADVVEIVTDMRQAAEQATTILTEMIAVARPPGRKLAGPPVAQTVRAAVDLARPAIETTIELQIELDDHVRTYLSADELEAIVLAALLDTAGATQVCLRIRERVIQAKRWVELLRADDRHHLADSELAHAFESPALLHVVAVAAKQAGGEASLAPGRGGLELAIELPVA